jgi:hypothetical protein
MNGKFLVLLILSLNIVSIMFAFGMYQAGNDFTTNNYMVDAFVNLGVNQNPDVLVSQGGAELDGSFQSSVEGLTKQESSGTGSDFGFFSIIDGLKMVLAMLSILTPLPILSFFYSLGMPFWFNLLLGLPVLVMYVLAILEFVRNGSF